MVPQKLFLSYSRTDSELVEEVRGLLKAQGVATFLDRDDLVAGEPWPQALEDALREAAAVAVFVGPDGFGKWQKREVYFALDRQAQSDESPTEFPVIPVLLPGAETRARFLFLNTWVDLRRDLQDPEGLKALVRAVRGATAEAAPLDREAAVCPYRGLRSFEEEDAALFFGREELSARLLDSVLQHRVVAVVGPSGSGKSSIVKAGLLPMLRRLRPPGPAWDAVIARPGDRPFHRLAGALLPELEPDRSEVDLLLEVEKLGTALETGEIRVQDVVERILARSNGTDRLLLVVDQFEELFTLTPEEHSRRHFAEEVLGAVTAAPLHVVLTLRADFYGNAVELHRDLSDALERALVNVGPMRREELERAIEAPARRVGYELAPGLAERIRDAVAESPGSLPLLEFALTELWERRHDGQLTHEAYEEIGEVRGAVAKHAEAELAKLSEDQSRAARTLFTRLVRVARPEEGAEDTRRRVTLTELSPREREVAKALAAPGARLLVTDRDETTQHETVEIVHEALIRSWSRLQRWLDADREFLLWRQRLGVGLAAWKPPGQGEEDEGALLRGRPLVEAERWLEERRFELTQDEARFIEASVGLRESLAWRKERRRRGWAAASGGAAVVLLGVATVIGALYLRAERRAEELRASSIVIAADAAEDPLVGTLVLSELRGDEHPDPPLQWIDVGRRLAEARIPLAILRGHTEPLTNAVFSPDGTKVVTMSVDGRVMLWSADGTGEPVVLEGHGAAVWSAAFSPDGSKVVTASRDRTARVWRSDGSSDPVVLEGHAGGVWSAVFSPDGMKVATASADRTARVWNADGHGEPVVLEGHSNTVYRVAFSPDGEEVVTASPDGTARVWPIDGSTEPVVLRGHGKKVSSAGFSGDGTKVVTASADGTARIWQADGSGEPIVLRGHREGVNRAVFSPDGSEILTASDDGTARVWRSEGYVPPVVLQGEGELFDAVFSPDGDRVAAASLSLDGLAFLWRADGAGEPVRLEGHGGPVWSVSFSRDGSKVVTASDDGTARVWRAEMTLEPVVLRGHEDQALSADFDADDARIVTASADGTIRVWRADGKGEPVVIEADGGVVYSARFSPDGSRIAAALEDGSAQIWQTDGEGAPMVLRRGRAPLLDIAYSPDGSKLATASGDGRIAVWRADGAGAPVVLKVHENGVHSVEFSADGSKILSASSDGTVKLSHGDGAGRPRLLMDHQRMVYAAALSPDGSRVVTTPAPIVSSVSNIAPACPVYMDFVEATGEPIALQGHQYFVYDTSFSPDGSLIVTASADGTARLWKVDGAQVPLMLGRPGSYPVNSAAFSSDGTKVVTTSSSGNAYVWTVGWRAVLDLLRSATTVCLEVEQRMRLLSETLDLARSRYEACERKYGRDPRP